MSCKDLRLEAHPTRGGQLELPRFSGRFISCDSFGFMGNSAGGLLKVHGREISEC